LFVQSGEIEGNPFLICNDLTHELGVKTYSGSITIHWTTTSYQDGKTVTQHHSQVLTAEVTKPCPYYSEVPYVVYGYEAAPDLMFSRMDSNAENMTQKQIDKEVDRKIKKLNKKAEKSISQGDSYTVLGNSEFEVLFGATNRNHEVQFRLLFTPLAQKNLLCLMKDKVNGFGDDFAFFKNKMINRVYPEQLKSIELSIPDNFFHNYDYEAIKAKFIHHNNAYMRHLYFAFAPLMSIPLYRQQRPHEYIYKDLYDSYVSYYAHEFVANSFGADYFMHPFSETRNILKTHIVQSEDNRDTIAVTAYGYRTEQRTDYINKLGRDGRVHTTPVNWTEYIPVMDSKYLDIDVFDDEQALLDSPRYREFFKDNPQGAAAMHRIGIFLASLPKQ
ncbi:MAG: hypothetical protein GX800_06435, partial [Clostridiaceae bacterium]|nr:hypothetical protein [Clostridiaceae bacterium]